MIPDERLSSEGTEFPFLGPAVGVLALYAILAVIVPANFYRSLVAIAAFFAMGYAALALITGRRFVLTVAEVLAFTVGLTILITSLAALGVSLAGIPITEFAVIVIGLPLAVLTWLLRRPKGRPWSSVVGFARRYFDMSDYTPAEKGIASALFVAITIALALFVSLAAIQAPETLSPAIAITGTDGLPGSLPTTFVIGQAQTVVVTVLGGSEAGTFTLRIRLVPMNATGSEPFHAAATPPPLRLDPYAEYQMSIAVAARGTWSSPFSIVMDETGTYDLRFDLMGSASTPIAGNRLPVQVP